ncbi:hypothetical protein RISK_001921 [Rhodopirellula islandica]|uniref:Ice-binding protein C-terminal domain-containing protein n=1 Tax=Rhodopirellula islandica TaxID=595434 RepID=A0A0J1BHQ1_RHOIS|nr:PEP-CTERM sorting domain-containing protein [Rhodopirellula islandica]KLU06070.1 hypothetical protein RISK_001921 [Rhodopirellula islandica]
MKMTNLTMKIALLAIGLTLSSLASTEARAALTLTIDGPQELTVGQSATYSVFGTSDNDDEVDFFAMLFTISGDPGLAFSATQSDDFLTNPDYVFFDRSGNVALGLPATTLAGGSLSIADFSDDQSAAPDVGLPDPFTLGVDSQLIGQFSVDAVSAGTFSIAIDPTSSFNDLSFNLTPFSSTPLSVTAVPEPSSLLAMAGVAGGLAWRRRGKTQRA